MSQMWIFVLISLAVGVLIGWALRRPDGRPSHDLSRLQAEHDNLGRAKDDLVAQLTAERRLVGDMREEANHAHSRIATLEAELRGAERRADDSDHRHRSTLEGLEDARERATTAEVELSRLSTVLEKERLANVEKIELLSQVRADMEHRFKQLAADSLRLNGEESKQRLEAALAPLKQHVEHFQTELRNVHQGALQDRATLKTEIEALTRRSEEVSREAVNLTRALKGDKQKQGAWGEMILESLLERSGLRKGEEYLVQEHRVNEDGARFRPDVVVNMPDGKRLVIDSKVSLVDYETCVNCEDEGDANLARVRHVRALKNHIQTLHEKAYHRMEEGSVDYVVMFIPIEGALSEALREMGDLTTMAFEKSVTIATPTTLMMALRTISNVWTIERRNQNAEAIADRAGRLYEKVAGFVDDMEKVGRNLGAAQSAYGDAMGKLSSGRGNMLSQLETMKVLGAKTSKSFRTEFDHDPSAQDDLRLTHDAAE
ncbi:DNA recombination protein RmuC [Falsirhodobacter sp. 20TX0035]|uniref:DNA recombination protein RmuC n=1 Tax=Falsirhodobacter sp. 20TX0035 TaxID=3022019 RepID=UPI0023306004|nr:DNA recombination protein RmuC [Falsirhodobacter sp. 20TX0035]MDB6452230.1 DNA recombination protein RmuC [Falsirhodobacter sp. 20TX0035]